MGQKTKKAPKNTTLDKAVDKIFISPLAGIYKAYALIQIWFRKRKADKNERWRKTMRPGEGCYYLDDVMNKRRVVIHTMRAGERGDVTVQEFNAQGQVFLKTFRKHGLYKY